MIRLFLFSLLAVTLASARQPNIVFILADDWLVIARSAAGGQTEALHGATVIESGTEPRAVEVLAPQSVDDLPAAFLRFRIDPVD